MALLTYSCSSGIILSTVTTKSYKPRAWQLFTQAVLKNSLHEKIVTSWSSSQKGNIHQNIRSTFLLGRLVVHEPHQLFGEGGAQINVVRHQMESDQRAFSNKSHRNVTLLARMHNISAIVCNDRRSSHSWGIQRGENKSEMWQEHGIRAEMTWFARRHCISAITITDPNRLSLSPGKKSNDEL